jgi:hypothetical protein
MIPDFSGDYISANSIKDGDIIEIIDEGKMEYSEALKKDTFNLHVKLNERVKVWSPNNTHGKELQKAFGLDSKEWIGKKVQLMLIQDKMLIKPLIAQKV